MGASDNASRVRAGYDAFNQGDVPVLMDLFAEGIVWHFPGTSKLGGDHVGRDATLAALGAYGEAGGGTLKANVIDVMASDDHVAGMAHDTAAAGREDARRPRVGAVRDDRREDHRGVALRRRCGRARRVPDLTGATGSVRWLYSRGGQQRLAGVQPLGTGCGTREGHAGNDLGAGTESSAPAR